MLAAVLCGFVALFFTSAISVFPSLQEHLATVDGDSLFYDAQFNRIMFGII